MSHIDVYSVNQIANTDGIISNYFCCAFGFY
jgi:hypothetical protein